MSETDKDPDLGRLRQNFDLLMRAQSFGRTGYIVSDVARDRVYWSDSMFELRKVPRRPFFTREEGMRFVHPDYREEFNRLRLQAIADRREFEHEMRIICGDGSEIWERGSSQPQFDADGNFTGLLSVVHDITESKTASASLLEQEATYRTLFNSIGDAIFLTLDGVFVDCNDAALRVFGATREQLINHAPQEFSPPRQPDGRSSEEKAREKIAAALGGERQTFEWRHMRADGTEFDAEVVLSRVENATEPLFFGVVRDISERKRAELALKDSHEKFAGAFNSSVDAMIVLRIGDGVGDGIFLDANPAAAQILGIERSDLVGKTVNESGLMGEAGRLALLRKEMLEKKMVQAFPATLRRHKRGPVEVEISASLFDAADDTLAILVIRDVTEQHAAERKIGELNASLQASVRQLRAIADNLPVGIGHTDLEGRILFLNKTAEGWLATTVDKARGRKASELFPPDYIEATAPMREAFARGVSRYEQIIPMPDGQTRVVEAINIPDIDEAGILNGFFGLTIDVTERRQAEDELLASHEKFAGAFQYSTDAMWVSTVGDNVWDARILDFNRSAERMLGFKRDEVIGQPVSALRRGGGASSLEGYRAIMERDGHVRDYPATLRRADGSEVETMVSGSRFLLGGKQHTLTVIRDVTEALAAERKIRELNESLQTSVRQLRAIADNLPVAISHHDAERRLLFMNRTMEQWFATKGEAALGRAVDDFVSQDYLTALRPVRDQFRNDEQYRAEAVLPYPDGQTRAIDLTFVPEKDDDAAGRYYTLAVDISDRKQAEADLKASHDKFSSAFEYSTDAMMVTRFEDDVWAGIVIDANRSAQRFLEVPRERIIGGRFDALRANLDAGRMEEFRRRMVSDGDVRDMPLTLTFPNNVTVHVLISAASFRVAGQNYMLAIIRNVTEAVAAERKILELNASLEDSLRQLRAIADNIPVAISYQDAKGLFQFVNHTMEIWFNAKEADMIGQSIHPFVSEAYMKAIEPIRARRNAGLMRSEITLPYPDGVARTVELTFVAHRDAEGALVGYYTLAIDMTERKAAEEQLQQSQKMQAIGKLTGGVAHDFNNLLGVISGNLELAKEALSDKNPQVAKLLEPARRAAERGSTLTRSLLSFARQQPLSPQVTDLNGLARDMTELLRRTLPSNIGIEFVGGAGLWTSEIDPGQLQNALLNLVVNARDAMPDGGRLTVETQNARIDRDYAASHGDLAPGQYVMLAVSDTGTGMPPDVIARAFDPFFTTKALGEGTGLGLSMVYGFAKQSGGHVAIYSEVGSGTTVKLYLPRWVGKEEEAAPRVERGMPAAQNETVLVVEDDDDMRFIAVTMLRSLGYSVLEATRGAKALETLDAHKEVALLVTDVVLAGSMNGRRLAEEATTRRPGLKVLYMSGYTEDAIVHHGRLEHGVHFIQKPFRKQDLAAKAREALSGR